MSIQFNGIPNTQRVPFTYVEFDNSKAQQGPAIQQYKTLIFGQKLAAGSAAVDTVIQITSEAQGRQLFGAGSLLHGAISKYFDNDKVTELFAVAQDDDGAAVKRELTLTVTGVATESGLIYLYVGGRRITVPVSSGDDQDAIAAAIAAAVQAEPLSYFSASSALAVATLQAKNGGEVANEIDVRFNYLDTESFPAGVSSIVIAQSVAGAGNPDVDDVIAAISETQYNTIINPYVDATNLGKIEGELADRWGPLRQNDGVSYSASNRSFALLSTLGNSRNSKHVSIMGYIGPSAPFEVAAAYGGQVSKAGQADPARPFQTLALEGILAPTESERFTLQERNTLLFDGIATQSVGDGGVVRIERAITTWQTNDAGAPDSSYLDVNTLLTLSYLRYSFRVRFQTKFPRHKLADDGTRFGPGQRILTPLLGKAEAVAIFAEWETAGLVEGLEQFKRDLIVERNSADKNRLDFLLPPDLINQLRVVGAQIQFLL